MPSPPIMWVPEIKLRSSGRISNFLSHESEASQGYRGLCLKVGKQEDEEMAHLAMCLLIKQEDLSLTPQHPQKS